jgi:hypothetical protein
MTRRCSFRNATWIVLSCAAAVAQVSCAERQRSFAAPEDAVKALIETTKKGTPQDIAAMFGPEGRDLVDSDPATAKRNREVFSAAVAERWSLADEGTGKVLVVGNENWPFPIPLVKDANGWRFDTAAGKEEVIARRIGRNELAVIRICRTYVAAQRIYAQRGHDGLSAGLYARAFQSDSGRQNGLYWPTRPGEKPSPLGDLVAQAAAEGRQLGKDSGQPSPFHGYYFRILTAQGADAPGGAQDYVIDGKLSKGFALVAWPATYDVTGVMTFIVNQDSTVREKDLGSGTDAAARAMAAYNPDASWTATQ